MRSRSPYSSNISYAGPGPLTPAIKVIVIACVILFFAQALAPEAEVWLGLWPNAVIHNLWIWQLSEEAARAMLVGELRFKHDHGWGARTS